MIHPLFTLLLHKILLFHGRDTLLHNLFVRNQTLNACISIQWFQCQNLSNVKFLECHNYGYNRIYCQFMPLHSPPFTAKLPLTVHMVHMFKFRNHNKT